MTNDMEGQLSSFLLSSLWRASWQGALALVCIWLLCRVLGRRLTADTHCWLWRLSYVKLVIGLIWGGAILVPLLAPAAPSSPLAQPPTVSALNQPASEQKMAITTGVTGAAAAMPAARADAKPQSNRPTYFLTAYGFGVVFCLGRLLLAARRSQCALKSAIPNTTEAETACAVDLAWSLGLQRVPPIARSFVVDSPVFIAGKVLLPSQADYKEADLRMILAHELAHAKRRDLLWEWLGTCVQVLFFFHPLVVLARREERLAREAAADALALQATKSHASDYGKLLLSLALEQNRPRPMLVGTVGVIEGGTLLRRRLLALRDGAARQGAYRNRWRIAAALVPLMAFVLTPWQMTHGQAAPLAILPAPIGTAYSQMPAGNKQIRGVVRDEQGKPVAGIDVALTWRWSQNTGGTIIGGSSGVGRVATDAQGRFTFSSLPADKYEYEVWSQSEQYVPVSAPLVIARDDAVKTVRVVVSTGSLVTGRVVDGQTGKPLAGVWVGAGSIPLGGDLAKWGLWAMPSTTQTDAQGRYQVRVMPGNVFVSVGRTTSNTIFDRRVRDAVQKVSVRPGQTAAAPDLSVLLHPVIICEGADGQPVTNTTIRIVPDNMTKDGWMVNDHTDETGTVVLNHTENGSFSIIQEGRFASGTFHSSPDHPLVITTDGQTQSFPSGIGTVHLTASAASVVMGSVVSEGGKPISNALIHVIETDPKSHYVLDDHNSRTDASGLFHAPLDPDGEYHVYVRADGFNQVSVDEKPLTLQKGVALNLGTVRLMRASGFVSGRVVDSFGRPMPGVVAWVDGGKTFMSAAITDKQGRFRIPNVVSGEVLRLELTLKGEVHDSGTSLRQSNEIMDFPGVRAGPREREIVWRPHR